MKILTVTNMWPIPQHNYFGIFVKEQVEGLNNYSPNLKNKVWFINGFRNRFNYLISIFQINYHLILNKYDIIHIHFGLSGLFLILNPFIKTPVVTTLHGSDLFGEKSGKLFAFISKLVVRRSNHIFYINDKILEIFEAQKSKFEYLPCGVNAEIFEYRKVENSSNYLRLAFPASIKRPEKNYEFFCKIIENIKSHQDINVEIFEIHGKTRKEVCDILNTIDVLVMTSTREGSPQIIKEAMCCNTPIVTSNVGNVSVLLKNVTNCYVINEFNEELFSSAILRIMKENNGERISNGRQKIFELGLDEKTTSKKIINAYKSLIL